MKRSKEAWVEPLTRQGEDAPREPDVIVKFWLVLHGYEVVLVVGGVESPCGGARDYGGNAPSMEAHVRAVVSELAEMLGRLRERFSD